MAKITLDIEEKNIKIVENILSNLKDGLIRNIEVTKRRYSPKNKVLEDKFMPKKNSNSKYLSPSEFKRKISKR